MHRKDLSLCHKEPAKNTKCPGPVLDMEWISLILSYSFCITVGIGIDSSVCLYHKHGLLRTDKLSYLQISLIHYTLVCLQSPAASQCCCSNAKLPRRKSIILMFTNDSFCGEETHLNTRPLYCSDLAVFSHNIDTILTRSYSILSHITTRPTLPRLDPYECLMFIF